MCLGGAAAGTTGYLRKSGATGRGLARWSIRYRRYVLIGWVAIAVLTSVIAGAVGRNYATNFTIPGTEAQRAQNLLAQEFKQQSGDLDTIVWHTSRGTVNSSTVRNAIAPVLARVRTMPHVVAVTSPYGSRGALQISRDRQTAFAVVGYDKRANLLPDSTGRP